jgi:hypothetical protein
MDPSTNGLLVPTFSGCGFFPSPGSVPPGTTFLQMVVRLTVTDSAGRSSTEAVNQNVKVLPNQQCGYGF